MDQIDLFVQHWPAEQKELKRAFLFLIDQAEALPGVSTGFVARPGVSHSVRFDLAPRPQGRERPVFFLVDAVSAGGEIFLSVCFYEDEISDPQELGNAIPQGLFSETGYCFDVDDANAGDQELLSYLAQRLREAFKSAAPA